MNRLLIFFTILFCFWSTAAHCAVINEVQWEDLVPPMPAEENPFIGMTEEEEGFAEWIIYLRETLPEEITERFQEFYDEMNEAIPELKKKGIDVDEIIAERRHRNNSINESLDGTLIKLAGYLLPLDLSGTAVTDFLLVPYIGACIHAPPPPPNQIVHAVTISPTPFEVNKLFEPVSVTGIIKAQSLSKELFLVDGSSDIDIGYTMSVEKIEKYRQ